MLDSSDSKHALSLSDALNLDAIWPVGTERESSELSETRGYRWPRHTRGNPFEPDSRSFRSLLASDWALNEAIDEGFINPKWAASDPLEALFGVWFGRHRETDKLHARFASRAGTVHLEGGNGLPAGLVNFRTPITATTFGIEYRGVDRRAAVLKVDPENPDDLIRFWNLRATGADVFPWPEGKSFRILSLFEIWLSRLTQRNRAEHDKRTRMLLWGFEKTPHALHLPHVKAKIGELIHEEPSLHIGWFGDLNTLETRFKRTFSVRVELDEATASVPLPAGPPTRYSGSSHSDLVAAQIVFYSEDGLPPGTVAAVPHLRGKSHLLDTMMNFPGSFERISPQGRVIVTPADSHDVQVGFTTSLKVFESLFSESSWKISHTEGGRLTSQLIDILGGSSAYPGNQPAVRRVLDDAARSVTGKRIPTLIQSAQNHKGEWPDGTFVEPGDYPKSVVYQLLYRKLLQPFLEVRCPHCSTKSTLRPEELSGDTRCEICRTTFPLGFALGASPGGRNDWVYRLAGNLAPERLNEILSVSAVQSVVADLLAYETRAVPHVYGVIAELGKWKCEVDIVAMADGDMKPVVVLGEVKSYRDFIDKNDLENLVKIQNHLTSPNLDCIILAGTIRDSLNDSEREDLRSVCEEARTVEHANGRIYPSLPLILTGRELSVPRMHKNHPLNWDSRFDIFRLAEETCRRNLGMKGINFSSEKRVWVPEWE
ncbi:hypothetical protein ACWEPR_04120 [Streptomyces sp. NPDC004290]